MMRERPSAVAAISLPPSDNPLPPTRGSFEPDTRGDGGARGFLAALQLGDSLFPSGGFILSHGLETLAERGHVRNAAEPRAWLAMTLTHQIAPSDGVASAAAWDVADHPAAVREIDALLLATKLAREPREASIRTGRQLLATLASLVGGAAISPLLAPMPADSNDRRADLPAVASNGLLRDSAAVTDPALDAHAGLSDHRVAPPAALARLRGDVLAGRTAGTHAIVLGVAGRALGLGRRETILLLLHLHVAGCIGAALRLLDVDDVEMQRVRLDLVPTLCAATDAALSTPCKEMYACAPQTELMSMLHERATVRLFAT